MREAHGFWAPGGASCVGALTRLTRDLLAIPGEYGLRWLLRRLTRGQGGPPLWLRPATVSPLGDRALQRLSWLTSLLRDLATLPRRRASELDSVALAGLSRRWKVGGDHKRELFPLPICGVSDVQPVVSADPRAEQNLIADLVNAVITCLNALYGYDRSCMRAGCLATHRVVFTSMASTLRRSIKRLASIAEPASPQQCLASATAQLGGDPAIEPLCASRTDTFRACGRVNPLIAVPPATREMLATSGQLFPDSAPRSFKLSQPPSRERAEYARYVSLQLEADKVRLLYDIRGGGSVFARRKASGRQRVVWNGSVVSAWCVPPPKPLHLTSPTSLLWLETTPTRPFHLTKRDGECMFDQLGLPADLIPFMGQPPFKVKDFLSATGWTSEKLRRRGGLDHVPPRTALLFPAQRVWVMGVAWSSYVCQAYSVSVCLAAGFQHADFLADDLCPPQDPGRAVAVATDDIVVFSARDPADSVAAGKALDRALQDKGIARNV